MHRGLFFFKKKMFNELSMAVLFMFVWVLGELNLGSDLNERLS